jgi:hypothetical protein
MATNQKKNTKEQAVAQSLKVLTKKVSDQQKDLQFTAFYEKVGKGTVI